MSREFSLKSKGWELKCRDDITQGMMVEYNEKLLEAGNVRGVALNGAVVKAAVACGWIESPEALDVDAASPAMVGWIAGKVTDIIREAIDIPPE